MPITFTTHRLQYNFNDTVLIKNLSFEVAAGQALHVRGGNGAGKTTLLRCLAGRLRPNAGTVRFCGRDIYDHAQSFRKRVQYVGHEHGLKTQLSVYENLDYAWHLLGRDHRCCLDSVISELELDKHRQHLIGELSAGLKRRVALARLHLAPKARLWLLDEPFTALDVQSERRLANSMTEHCQRGGMIIFTSHQLPNTWSLQHSSLELTEGAPA